MKKIISLVTVFILFFSCSSDDGDGIATVVPVTPSPPSASTLVFPDNNQECNQGVDAGVNSSTVTFRWNASDNTDSYDLVLKNLDAQTTTTNPASTNELALTILKGTPFSWHVISKSSELTDTAQSPTWKFYNAGDPVQFYTPFPAELVAPTMGANLSGIRTQNLSWTGSDIDNDIASYDVYFGTVTPPTNLEGNTGNSNMDVTVAAGNTYYWKVITIDDEGNNSQSEIFQFKVD